MPELPKDAPPNCLEIPITIRFGDTDPYGVVYFASYFRYCHHGIEELMRHVGCPPEKYFRDLDRGFGLPIVGASCDFFRPAKYGDPLRLRVGVFKMSLRSITFAFYFFIEGRPDVVGRGHASMVAIDRTWRSCQLPEELRRALEGYIFFQNETL